MEDDTTKRYIVWVEDWEGFIPISFETLEEARQKAEETMNWFVLNKIEGRRLVITEKL